MDWKEQLTAKAITAIMLTLVGIGCGLAIAVAVRVGMWILGVGP